MRLLGYGQRTMSYKGGKAKDAAETVKQFKSGEATIDQRAGPSHSIMALEIWLSVIFRTKLMLR